MTTRKYAEGSVVEAPQSRAGIERAVERFGATGFGYGTRDRRAMVAFEVRGRQVRFVIELPDPADRAFWFTETGRERTERAARDVYAAEVRRRWRSLELVIKAKLAAVDDGIVQFEVEFLAQTVMPDGRTVAEHTLPAVQRALDSGQPAALLPALDVP